MSRVLIIGAVLAGFAAGQTPDAQQTFEELKRQADLQRRLLMDWAGLTRYGSEDTEVAPPAPGERRVVFLGDDATERWGAGDTPFFPGKPYFNRGIRWQTTPQMLVRFRQDVISLHPKVVVIQGGSNDIAALMGPATQGTMIENFMSMVELAKANGIRVVLASILPVCDCYTTQSRRRPVGKILGMNAWLKRYTDDTGSVYLDYYHALAEGRAFKKELTNDGLLPNDAGYKAMALVAEDAITAALAE